MITPAQCRAARAFLNWTLDDLARESKVSRTSLYNLERDSSNAKAETYSAIISAFERAGMEFTSELGVRPRGQKLEVRHWQGTTAVVQLMDDIYQTRLAFKGIEVLCCGINETQYEKAAGGHIPVRRQIKRMREHGFKERVILCEGDSHFTFPPDITSYRWIAPELFNLAPSIIYGNKHAVIVYGPPLSIVVTENELVAQTYRRQFELLWSMARPIPFTDDEIVAICEKNMPLG